MVKLVTSEQKMAKATPQKSPKAQTLKVQKTPKMNTPKSEKILSSTTPKSLIKAKALKTPNAATPKSMKKANSPTVAAVVTPKSLKKAKMQATPKSTKKSPAKSTKKQEESDEDTEIIVKKPANNKSQKAKEIVKTEPEEAGEAMEDNDEAMEEVEEKKNGGKGKNKTEMSSATSSNKEGFTAYVVNVDFGSTSDDIQSFFNKFGNVENVYFPRKKGGLNKGFGFVTFGDKEGLDAAVNAKDVKMGDRPLRISPAQPKGTSAGKRKREEDSDGPKAKRPAVASKTEVFVARLSFESTKKSVEKYFSKFGEVTSCSVPYKSNGKSKGFAFVNFADEDTLSKVLKQKHSIDNRDVVVERKLEKATSENKSELNEVLLRELHYTVDEDCIRDYFSKYGTIKKIRLPKGFSKDCLNKGFGFVAFSTDDEMNKAVNAGPHKLASKVISCTISNDKAVSKSSELQQRTIFVYDLPKSVTKKTIHGYFEKFGSVQDIIPSKTKRYAAWTILFASSDAAEIVTDKKHEISGKAVRCKSAAEVNSNSKAAKKQDKKVKVEQEMESDEEEEADSGEEEEADSDVEEEAGSDEEEEAGSDEEEEAGSDEEEEAGSDVEEEAGSDDDDEEADSDEEEE